MKKALNWVKENPNRTMFLIPILLVATISISHVITWYDIANPYNWAIFLSVAIEVGAIAALIAATNKIKGGVWFMFSLITLIQMVGNIFFSFKEIDDNGDLFKSWVELTGPIWEFMGTETTDIVGIKRWLAFLEGGLLPIISLTSLHFFVKYEKPERDEKTSNVEIKEVDSEEEIIKKSKDIEHKRVMEQVKKMGQKRKESMSEEEYQQMLDDEPMALANSNEIETEEDVKIIIDAIENTEQPNDKLKMAYDDYKELVEETNEGDNVSEKIEENEIDEDHEFDMVLNKIVEELEEDGELTNLIEGSDNKIENDDQNEIKNALKKNKEYRGEVVNQPYKKSKTNINRID